MHSDFADSQSILFNVAQADDDGTMVGQLRVGEGGTVALNASIRLRAFPRAARDEHMAEPAVLALEVTQCRIAAASGAGVERRNTLPCSGTFQNGTDRLANG